jgi:hypothetical protein
LTDINSCVSTVTGGDGACSWIYASNDNSNNSGICVAKSSQSVGCDDVTRPNQCINGGGITALTAACTYIYQSTDIADNSGSCISISDTSIQCENIIRTSQCLLGAEVTALFGKCGIYGNTCKTLCAEINGENANVTCKSRSEDCIWLEKNGTQYSGECINSVRV